MLEQGWCTHWGSNSGSLFHAFCRLSKASVTVTLALADIDSIVACRTVPLTVVPLAHCPRGSIRPKAIDV